MLLSAKTGASTTVQPKFDPAQLGNAVWRASDLARPRAVTCPTGNAALDAQLPGGGWPRSAVSELLLQQGGIGEIQLLQHALAELGKDRQIVLVSPPYIPQAIAAHMAGIPLHNLLWLRPQFPRDGLWASEQIIKSGIFGAVLLWAKEIRPESVRRLNLAAQGADTWVWAIRPMASARDASAAPLRIALSPAEGGVELEILKRQGPPAEETFFVPLTGMPVDRHQRQKHATPTVNIPAPVPTPSAVPVLA